ncbi:MAG: argininosuccinate lyase [Bacteroidales bacterium]|nr:argininosuccinate lyase [Bacteroidales bacterium]
MSSKDKLWSKGISVDDLIEKFTIGRDKDLDVYLAPFDALGSIAHTTMLESIGLLTIEELKELKAELINIYNQAIEGNFEIEPGVEDVHSQIELLLTRRLGDVGKKIHSARSRNDQVLLDIRLFSRAQLQKVVSQVAEIFRIFQESSNQHKDVLIPGYTHLQVAMPSSFGLWFGAYAESLADDLQQVLAAYKILNQNPLGSAAGYGSSFPINRTLTTELLGFDNLCYNVVYAQMGRGKTERVTTMALSSVAATLAKFAADACMFMSQNFGFISLPAEYTTGSSIMPHKKNPDVFELLRAKCNKIQAVSNEITLITNNLTSGYFRDLQIIKESYFDLFDILDECLEMVKLIVPKINVNNQILDNSIYQYLFSVEEVNKEVLRGTPFRDAYKNVGMAIEEGNFSPETTVNHTHEGSIGNLCNEEISRKFNAILTEFNFEKTQKAVSQLVKL